MLFLFVSLLGILIVLYLGGSATLGLLRLDVTRNPFLTCWLGFFALSVVLIPLSFFVPLNSITCLGVLALTIFGFKPAYVQYQRLVSHVRVPAERLRVCCFCLAILFILLVVTLANAYTVWPVHQYDTDLYHAQIVRWLNTYGMPWGLGNLHSRFANNSSWLDVAALLDNGPWDGRSAWVMVGLLVCLTLFYFFYEICFAKKSWAKIYSLCMVFPVLYVPEMMRPNLGYDSAAFFVHCIIVLEALYLWLDPETDVRKASTMILGLAALSFMIKPLAPITVCASLVLCIWIMRERGEFRGATLAKILVLPIVAAALWLGKNLVLSGYPLFPVPVLPMPFDWTMSRTDVLWNYEAVRGYARMGSQMVEALDKGITFWLPYWIEHQFSKSSFLKNMFLPTIFGCFAWGFVVIRSCAPKILAVLAWQVSCIVYWFAVAPDPRFGFGFAWSFFASGLALMAWQRDWALKRGVQMGGVLLGGILLARLSTDLHKAPHSWLIPQKIVANPVAAYILDGNGAPFTVWVPTINEKCGDADLPCSPSVPVNLCLRQPGNLGQGFRQCEHQND